MEGNRQRSAVVRAYFARGALSIATAIAVAACASASPPPTTTPNASTNGTLPRATGVRSFPQPTATATDAATSDIPDAPKTTSAVALTRPQRGSSAPIGAVVFGTDVAAASQKVSVTGERTTFAPGRAVAWRVTLPEATGGESVRVTLTTADDTETLVDEFVAQPGWNVYYGKSLLTVAPGTYVLHYLVDGHETGSGTFKIKGPDAQVPGPSAAASPAVNIVKTPAPSPQATPAQQPTANEQPTATPEPTKAPRSQPGAQCISAYPDFCIRVGTPDLDCPDMGHSNFTVLPPDPMRFDADHDGIGCET